MPAKTRTAPPATGAAGRGVPLTGDSRAQLHVTNTGVKRERIKCTKCMRNPSESGKCDTRTVHAHTHAQHKCTAYMHTAHAHTTRVHSTHTQTCVHSTHTHRARTHSTRAQRTRAHLFLSIYLLAPKDTMRLTHPNLDPESPQVHVSQVVTFYQERTKPPRNQRYCTNSGDIVNKESVPRLNSQRKPLVQPLGPASSCFRVGQWDVNGAGPCHNPWMVQ